MDAEWGIYHFPQHFGSESPKRTRILEKLSQFSPQSCPTLCKSMDRGMPGFDVHQQCLELVQTHVHEVSDVIQPSHPLSSPSPAFNLSQHKGLFQ